MKEKSKKKKTPSSRAELATGQANKSIIHKKHKEKNKETPECKHEWIPLIGRVGNKDVPTALFTCMKCGEMKVGTNTIRISRYRLDMGGHPLYAGDVVLGENAGLTLDTALSAYGKYCGIVEDGTAGATLAFGDLCYFITASSKWGLAKADSTTTSGDVKLGICVLAGNDTQATKILLYGKIRADAKFPTLTISAPVYVSGASAGAITVTAPTTINYIIRKIGFGNTADELFFDLSSDYYTYAYNSTPPLSPTWYGGRGVIFAGAIAIWTHVNSIDYITIGSLGNAADFGDLSATSRSAGALSSGSRGVYACVDLNTNVIEYITIATTGNSTDFGDALVTQYTYRTGLSNTTRGLFAGGFYSGGGEYNVIEYITIATTGNAVDFGDLTTVMREGGCCSNDIRGILGGGITDDIPTYRNIIDYITITSVGNATDFGDLTLARVGAACSNNILGVISGGSGTGNIIDYVTIATTGNATDFGDTTVARGVPAACSHNIKGVWAGSGTGLGSSLSNVIDYILFSTLSNTTDFGDLTVPRYMTAGCSGN